MPSVRKEQEQEKNPILQLNDIRKDCVYEFINDQGSTPERKYTFKLMIDGKTFFGSGPTKIEAKAASAASALKHPAVNVKASRYKSQQRQKKNFDENKQALYGKKARKVYQDRIADYNEDSGGYQYVNGKKVCRFYLNSMCLRGRNCPYLHPEYSPGLQNSPSLFPQVPLNESLTWLQFCDNYQHLRCPHANCEFLHVSRDDEELYVATGRIPSHIVEQAVRKASAVDKTPGISPCKGYLEGQCSWYSCPFRHVSRKDFSQEVLETLYKHFERKLRPRYDYHMPSRRPLDSPDLDKELLECGSHSSVLARRIPDEPPLSYENRFQDRRDYGNARPHSTGPNMLLKGMSNLMRDDNCRLEKELHDLHVELRMLREENAMLRNSYKLRVTEEENFFGRGHQRADFRESEKMYQEQLRRLRKENDEIWRKLLARENERQRPFYPLKQRNTGNSMFLEGFCPDMRPGMRQQLPEMHNFDELLDPGIKRMESQIKYTHLGFPTSLVTPKYQVPQLAKQQQQQKLVYDKSRMPGKIAQALTRPSNHGNKKSNISQPKKANEQQNKKFKKPGPQRKQQQKQKSFPPTKEPNQNVNDSDKDIPVVTIEKTNQESLVKKQREMEPRKDPGGERNPTEGQTPSNENVVFEDVEAEESAAACNLESIEKQSDGETDENEPTNQYDSSENEECVHSLETEGASNVTSENEEKLLENEENSLVVSD